jgi:Skp family chaperone for outer membrane proteins
MKKKLTSFIVVISFLSAISYSLEKALAETDYTKIISQKDQEIAKLKAELAEKDKEVNKWKAVCQKIGMNTEQKVQPKPSVKIIDKPFYGVRLGEDITQLAERVPVEFVQDIGVWKSYRVKSTSPDAGEVMITTLADKVATISAYPVDMTLSNYNAIIEGIKTEYPDVKHVATTIDRKQDFNVVIDQQEVGIVVMHKQRSELDVLLIVSYVYPEL